MSDCTIRRWVGCLTFALAAGCGCSNANRGTPASAASAPLSEDQEVMRPASALRQPTSRETSREPVTLARTNASESPIDQRPTAASTTSAGAPGCIMHAENTPGGIALIFSAQSNAPDRVAAGVQALAGELEREIRGTSPADDASAARAAPSSFGTRQIAQLARQTIVTQTPEGARLTIDARDPAQVEALRARVLWSMASFLPDSRDTSNVCPVVPHAAQRGR